MKMKSYISFYKSEEGMPASYYSDDNFFIAVEADVGGIFFQQIASSHIEKLADLENLIYENLKKSNLPAGVSASFVYLKDDIFYLKTVGKGMIFLKRNRDFALIIEGDNSASGYVKTGDMYVFTSAAFLDSINGKDKLKKYLSNQNPQEIVENIRQDLRVGGQIALFIKFDKEKPVIQDKPQDSIQIHEYKEPFFTRFNLGKVKNILSANNLINRPELTKKKKLTFLAVIIIFIILVWSVGLGYSRRLDSQRKEKITKTEDLVKQKLSQAEEVAFLNLPRAQILISESKEELAKLKKDLGSVKQEEIKTIEDLISDKESEILKKDEKKGEEFFDLTVDESQARGDRFYLDEDNLGVLNKNGKIYTISISKKSLDKKSYPEIKKAESIVLYQDKIFFYNQGEGVYKIEDDKLKKVIDNDKDWGKIIDFSVYNGNLYLLDQSKGDIYKYMVTDSGFSEKKSYFGQGESATLDNPNSISIDHAIYVGLNGKVNKYLGGVRDDFNTSYPEENITITKVFTSKDVDKVVVWDKNKGAVYILGKNGLYEKQITSSILKKAADFVAYGDNIYVLLGAKIYKIGI